MLPHFCVSHPGTINFTGDERYDLEEEVESFTEHPVEGGEVEEVGEGDGGAQQGLRQLGWQL